MFTMTRDFFLEGIETITKRDTVKNEDMEKLELQEVKNIVIEVNRAALFKAYAE